jgi:hypothetical protein
MDGTNSDSVGDNSTITSPSAILVADFKPAKKMAFNGEFITSLALQSR